MGGWLIILLLPIAHFDNMFWNSLLIKEIFLAEIRVLGAPNLNNFVWRWMKGFLGPSREYSFETMFVCFAFYECRLLLIFLVPLFPLGIGDFFFPYLFYFFNWQYHHFLNVFPLNFTFAFKFNKVGSTLLVRGQRQKEKKWWNCKNHFCMESFRWLVSRNIHFFFNNFFKLPNRTKRYRQL
jgi:hypothetical protein